MHLSENLVEIRLACRVLGIGLEQSIVMCRVMGIKPVRRRDEVYLERESLSILYRRLYPEHVA